VTWLVVETADVALVLLVEVVVVATGVLVALALVVAVLVPLVAAALVVGAALDADDEVFVDELDSPVGVALDAVTLALDAVLPALGVAEDVQLELAWLPQPFVAPQRSAQ
jgi:hypothetical protein